MSVGKVKFLGPGSQIRQDPGYFNHWCFLHTNLPERVDKKISVLRHAVSAAPAVPAAAAKAAAAAACICHHFWAEQ